MVKTLRFYCQAPGFGELSSYKPQFSQKEKKKKSTTWYQRASSVRVSGHCTVNTKCSDLVTEPATCKANKSHVQVLNRGFPGSSVVKNMGSVVVSPMQETQV